VLMRYWHFIEWLFEPELPSVRCFRRTDGRVLSDLEVPDWRARVDPIPGTAYAGLLGYLDDLPTAPAARIVKEADRAWAQLRRAVVWPDAQDSRALAVGARTHGLGREEPWGARPWRGPVAALRGSTMWREGEIALSETHMRLPLLIAIESAYGARFAWRKRRTARR
jgi:hypothetical protein